MAWQSCVLVLGDGRDQWLLEFHFLALSNDYKPPVFYGTISKAQSSSFHQIFPLSLPLCLSVSLSSTTLFSLIRNFSMTLIIFLTQAL